MFNQYRYQLVAYACLSVDIALRVSSVSLFTNNVICSPVSTLTCSPVGGSLSESYVRLTHNKFFPTFFRFDIELGDWLGDRVVLHNANLLYGLFSDTLCIDFSVGNIGNIEKPCCWNPPTFSSEWGGLRKNNIVTPTIKKNQMLLDWSPIVNRSEVFDVIW